MAKLHEKQLAAIAILARAGNTLSYEEVAEKVGCDVSTLRRWRNDDRFNDELKRQVMREAVADLPRIMASVPGHIIDDGNAAMFRTYLQSLGLLTEKHEVESKSGGTDIDGLRAEIERFKRRDSE